MVVMGLKIAKNYQHGQFLAHFLPFLSPLPAAFTEFKNHFRYILSYLKVKLPDELRNLHRLYELPNDDDHYNDNDCSCTHNQSISIPCHLEYFAENRDKYSEYSDESGCFLAVDDAWKTQDCYKDTLQLSSSLIQATSFAGALCYAQEIRNVSELCRKDWVKDLDTNIRQLCHWVRLDIEKVMRGKDHLLKVEDSARRTEPLLIRWRDHVLDIGFHNSFSLQVINVSFQNLPSPVADLRGGIPGGCPPRSPKFSQFHTVFLLVLLLVIVHHTPIFTARNKVGAR